MAFQRLAHELVLQLIGVIDGLGLGVLDVNAAVDRRRVDRHVHVLVDAHRQDEPAVLFVVRRQIGAAAAERHTEGGAGDDHVAVSFSRYEFAARW